MDDVYQERQSKIRRSPAQWSAIMMEYELKGISAKAFCNIKGLAFSTFCRWRRELKLRDVPGQEAFVPVREHPAPARPAAPEEVVPCWQVELDLGDGITLRVQRS